MTPCTPVQVRAALAIGIAVDLNASEVVLLGAVVDVADLILDVGEGFEDFALGEGVAHAAASTTTMATGAVAVDLGTGREWPLGDFAAVGQRPDVHEGPDRHQ